MEENGQFDRLVRQEEFILEVTEALSRALAACDLSRADLARKLGCTRSAVTQMLSGGRNLTLRSVADLAHALGTRPKLDLCTQREWDAYTVASMAPDRWMKGLAGWTSCDAKIVVHPACVRDDDCRQEPAA